jgi:hypothetical protein
MKTFIASALAVALMLLSGGCGGSSNHLYDAGDVMDAFRAEGIELETIIENDPSGDEPIETILVEQDATQGCDNDLSATVFRDQRSLDRYLERLGIDVSRGEATVRGAHGLWKRNVAVGFTSERCVDPDRVAGALARLN